MNRARPLRLTLLASVTATLLAGGVLVVAQQNRNKPQGLINRLLQAGGTSSSRAARKEHKYRGNMDKIPRDITLRHFDATKIRSRAPGDAAVTRQTVLLTKRNPSAQFSQDFAPSQDEHPYWTFDEKLIYFDSDRTSDTNPTPTTNFNIFRMFSDGSGVTQITTGTGNKIEPQTSQDGSRLAYVSGGSINPVGATNPATSGFNLFVSSFANGEIRSLTQVNPSGFAFTDVRHPSFSSSGSEVVFAGQTGSGTAYHIYIVNVDTGVIRQMTRGTSNDYSPAWSPDGNLIAFTTNATAFTAGNGPVTALSLANNDDIFVISPNQFQPNLKKVTGAAFGPANSSNKNPAWSTLKVDPLGVVPNEVNDRGDITSSRALLAFASNRADTNGDEVADAIAPTTDIYYLQVGVQPDPASPGSFTIKTPESAGNPALKLRNSTPDTSIDANEATSKFDPTNQWNEDYPAWPQYISSYRIAFQSDRGNNLNIWASTIFDINAPTLLKYNIRDNEIIQVSRNSAPGVSVREASAGESVRFRVRVSDYESGVYQPVSSDDTHAPVYIQLKAPDSAPQSSDGKEHKVYFVGPGVLDLTRAAVLAPYEWDAQAIKPNQDNVEFREPGFVGPSGQTLFGGIPPEWPGWNLYIPGTDDEFAFSGHLNPPDNEFWLPLYDDGAFDAVDPAQRGHEPTGEVKGDGVFSASWRSPVAFPSDWMMDLIVYDNAVNPFDPNITTNWKIYDNVWGFSTKPFVSQGTLLYVNDYDAGQKFFTSHFGTATGTAGGQSFTAWPTESWMTEIDPGLLPTSYSAPNVLGSLLNVLNPLGQVSYADSLTNDGTAIPITQRYDQWRILCRGPLPESVLNQYGARVESQPSDVIGGGTGPRQQVVAERCIVWHSPYSGDLFVGSGTLIDVNVQNQLKAFVGRGGRMLVTGQDIAWALSLGGGTQNAFLNSVLRVSYFQDFIVDPMENQITMVRGSGIHPISTQTWYQEPVTLHNYPAPPNTNPPWDPPAAGPIYLGSIPGTIRSWMCLNQSFFDVVDFLPTPAQDVAGIDATYVPSVGSRPAIMWNLDNAATRGKIVFSPFGWEGINPEFFTLPGNPPPIVLKNRRTEIMHNALDYLRTGRIVGSVRDINGAQPLSRVFIRAVDFHTGLVAGTTLSQANGEYVLNGLDPTGIYQVDTFVAGFITAHNQGTPFHGGYQSRLDLFLTPAQPGTINGVVTLESTGTPIAGAVVTATNPVTGEAYTATTDSLGRYSISAPVISDPANPTSTAGYIVRVTNLAQLGYSTSIPPSYGGGEAGASPAVKVGPSENVTGIDFKLKPLPGRILGNVVRDSDGSPIKGALVTATNGTLVFTATTDADGNYVIPSVEPGTYGVVASAVGFSPSASISAVVATNADTININFRLTAVPPGSISGLVQTTSGQSIIGATITITDTADNPVLNDAGQPITATTVAEQTVSGYRFNYIISGVPAGGTVRIRARKDGYQPDPTPAVNVVVPSNDEAKNINFTLNPLFQFSRELSLVSAPYDYTKSVLELFGIPNGDLTNGNFLFVTWDQTAMRYVNATTFQLGKGYFLESRNPATTLSIIEPGVAAPETQIFEIPLKEGWNMIGTPFKFPLNLYGLKIREADGSIVDITAAQAGSSPAIGGALWTYDNGAYQLAYTLDPWRGYWIRAFRNVTLLVPPTARQDRGVKLDSRAPQLGNARGDGWSLDLLAKAGTIQSAPSRIGISRAAADTYDRFKLESPPAVGESVVTLTTEHTDWASKNGKYSLDMRSASSTAQTWDFTVGSNVRNTPVTIQWPAIATVPGKIELVLTDLDNKTVLDMRTRSSYTLPAMQDNTPRHLRVEMRRASRQSLEVLGLSATVNRSSTGGRAATSAAISYNVTADAETQVTILQNGKRIRTIETGRHRAAGSADALWDLKDEKGQPVGSNAYTVEVRASDSKGRTRRQVVPLLITR